MQLDIWNDIEKNKFSSLYLLYGKETFLINETKKLIISRSLTEDEKEFNLSSYDMEETPVELAIEDCQTFPFFGDKKVVVINRPYFLTAEKRKEKVEHQLGIFESYIKEPSPDTILILTAPYEKLDERKKLLKLLKKNAVIGNMNPLSIKDMKNWAKAQFQKEELSIKEDALDLLIHFTGSNLAVMNSEIKKLALFCEKGSELDTGVIEAVAAKSLEGNVFTLIDRVLRHELKGTMEIYHHLLNQNEEPIQILAVIASQIRLIYQVKFLGKKGYGQKQIAGHLKVHPYRVKLAMQQGGRFSEKHLLNMIEDLAEIDYKMKTGQGSKEELLEFFFLKYLS